MKIQVSLRKKEKINKINFSLKFNQQEKKELRISSFSFKKEKKKKAKEKKQKN